MKPLSTWFGGQLRLAAAGAPACEDSIADQLASLTCLLSENIALAHTHASGATARSACAAALASVNAEARRRHAEELAAWQKELEAQVLNALLGITEHALLQRAMEDFASLLQDKASQSEDMPVVCLNAALRSTVTPLLEAQGVTVQDCASPGLYADLNGTRLSLALEGWADGVKAVLDNGK